MTGGAIWGLWLWKFCELLGREKMRQAKTAVCSVLFFGGMLALVYLLWRMK